MRPTGEYFLPSLPCSSLARTSGVEATAGRRPLLRSPTRSRGHSIGAAHVASFRVVAPAEAKMPHEVPQNDRDGGLAVGRDTGFPKHGAMLRIGAWGKRGAATLGRRGR